jgi:WD40 repeat protein
MRKGSLPGLLFAVLLVPSQGTKAAEMHTLHPDPGRAFKASIPVGTLAVLPDSKQVLVASSTSAQLWRWGAKKPTWSIKVARDAAGLAPRFSPDGKLIALAQSDHRIRLIDAGNGKTLRYLEGHPLPVRGLAFSGDGKLLVSCGTHGKFLNAADDHTIRLWNVRTGKAIRIFRREHEDTVCSVVFTPDGKQVFSGSADDTLRTWDVSTGKQLKKWANTYGTSGLTFSPDGKHWGAFRLGTVYFDGYPSGNGGRKAFAYDLPGISSGSPQGILFAPDSKSILAWGEILDVRTKQVKGERRPRPEYRGVTIVVQRWDVETAQLLATFTRRIDFEKGSDSRPDRPRPLAITPDSRHLLTGATDGTVTGWALTKPAAKQKERP